MSVPSRELLMLLKDYAPDKHVIDGWYMSEKLDGVRAFWDGGITIDKPIRDIPWANTGNKNRLVPRSTGLWSRYGNVICAPTWFTDALPRGTLLDGELWLARGCLEETRSIVSRHQPDGRWRAITFNVFDMPSLLEFCKTGNINGANNKMLVREHEMFAYYGIDKHTLGCQTYKQILPRLNALDQTGYLRVINQQIVQTVSAALEKFDVIVADGGEGVVLRRPYSFWTPHRNTNILRIKPKNIDRGVVLAHNPGKGKHLGRMGSLTIGWEGVKFDLSGFTDSEREDVDTLYPIGSVVRFHYNGFTNGGIPREARYVR